MSTPQQPYQGDPNQQPGERIVYVEKKKKGGCMKWGAIIVGAIVLIAILATVFGGGDDSSSGSSNEGSSDTQAGGETEQVEEGTDFALGETYTTRDGMDILVSSFGLASNPLGQNACAEVTYTNNGDEQASFQGYWDWKVQNPAGVMPIRPSPATASPMASCSRWHVSGSVLRQRRAGEYRLVEPTLSSAATPLRGLPTSSPPAQVSSPGTTETHRRTVPGRTGSTAAIRH